MKKQELIKIAEKSLRAENCPHTSVFYDLHRLPIVKTEVEQNKVRLFLHGGHIYSLIVDKNSQAYKGKK